MPERIFHKVTIVTENAKDMLVPGSVGAFGVAWLTDLNLMIQIGVGVLTGIFIIVRTIYWLRRIVLDWHASPTKR